MASKGDLESETDALTNEDFLPSSTTETNCHQIYQNDESITVVCREPTSDQLSVNDAKYSDKSLSSGCQDKENEKVTITNNVRKFIEGDEIKDSENPFRKPYRKTSKSVRYKLSESDCITKEEILKQSKYVPVYIKNPDSVLTYPILNEKQSQDSKLRKPSPAIRKFPTPAPRTVIEKPKRLNKSKNHQIYPNLSDIKVKVGTDLDETFFDQNEVILNAKKFDSLFNRMKFNSTEDLDDIEALNLKNISHSKADTKDEETKSYTNTVNSKEFREYLQKAGLVLFPVKNSFDVAEPKKQTHMKKKTMIKRLSSIFTRSKMPYSAENEKSFIASNKLDPSRFSSTDSTDYFGVKNNVRAPFKTSDVFSKKKREIHNPDIDDWKSSISSVLSAADTEDYLSSPAFTIKKGQYMAPAGKFQRNQLNQTMPDSYSFEKQDNLNRMNPKLRRNVVLDNHQSYQTSMDPFTFAQIHKVKRQTDENFQKDSWLEPEYQKMPQQHFNSEKKHLRETRLRSVLVNRNLDYQNNLKNNDSHRSSLVSPVKELNREEVMNKIYEYYRKSVNNTPVPRDVKDNLYSTLPNRPVKVNQPNGFARISNPIQNQHKIYDEVNKSSVTSHEFSVKRNLNFNTIGNSSLSMKPAVTCSPMQQPRSNNVSPKKMNSSQRSSLYSSQVFRPISELCSKFFTDSRISRKSKDHQHQRLRILDKNKDDYQNDKSRIQQNDESRRSSGRREDREKELRRLTTGMDMHHYGNHSGSLQRSMDLEMGQSSKSRKGIVAKGYAPQHQGPLFDDDPGIMSEVETASTGFRRGGKQRSSLPVVRTPSKTLERPLGLVFLQYRSETKRALLPNEITSIDTVRALFVRSFPRQLSMIYLEGPNVKIYIHDSSKDMFYELEDVRSHLREIRDRSVLRLFESNEVAAAPQILSGNSGVPQQLPQQSGHWDQDPSYFSEPEFDSEYQHQHVHKSKGLTLPRGHVYNDRSKGTMNMAAKPMRSYGSRGSLGQFAYPSDQLYSIPDGYMSSPERGTRGYEEPYYTQYGSRGSSITPVIDEEQNTTALMDDQYSLYSVKVPNRPSRNPNQMYDTARPEDLHRIRVEHMERQLANLTGLVQKALVQNPQPSISVQQAGPPFRNDKSVSFEKSVSFSDEIEGVSKTHSPQQMADSKPPKPAIKSSTLPRTSSQERDRLKPVPPLKQTSSTNLYQADLTLAPEAYNHLRGLQKKARDLRNEVKLVRRLTQTQAVAVREDIKDTFMRIRATLLTSSGNQWGQSDPERTRISREEEIYKQEVIRLEKDLADLEGSVEVLRGEVINRRTRVNMSAVEDMALVLSRASKIVAELKMRFPTLQQNLRGILSCEMEKVCREEAFLKDEPNRLEIALRRCKKLTGTLVTLKRLASVQEQRTSVEPSTEETQKSLNDFASNSSNKPTQSIRGGSVELNNALNFPENALDALLDELQTFAKPSEGIESHTEENVTSEEIQNMQHGVTINYPQNQSTDAPSVHGLRRLHSYPSGSDTDQDLISPPRPAGKPPVPERNSDVMQRYGHKKLPPPPPPRSSSSRSPTTSLPNEQSVMNANNSYIVNDQDSGSESNNSQDNSSQRQLQLEMRHQELLKKQKNLQEQYLKLQQMSKNTIPLASNEDDPKKKVNELSSMKNIAGPDNRDQRNENISVVTTSKVYETEIL